MLERAIPAATADMPDPIEALRLRIGRIGGASARPASDRSAIRFGLDGIDGRLPGGGLAPGALHEILGHGPDTEHATLASQLVAALLARHDPARQVLWAMQGSDLFAPGLSGVGLHPDRLILAQCGRSVLAVMEEALRHPGLAAVVGEVEGRLGLTASRRLQLAAEASGVTAFAIRRSRRHDDPALLAPSAAASRWRISAVPSRSSGQTAGQVPGPMPDRMLWRLELLRCRGTALVSHWTLQACDARHRLAVLEPAWLQDHSRPPDRPSVAAALADRPAQAAWARYG